MKLEPIAIVSLSMSVALLSATIMNMKSAGIDLARAQSIELAKATAEIADLKIRVRQLEEDMDRTRASRAPGPAAP